MTIRRNILFFINCALFILTSANICLASVSGEDIQPDKAAYWEGKLWFLKEQSPKNNDTALFSLKLESNEKPKLEIHVNSTVKRTWLLGDKDRLWLITTSSVMYFKEGKIKTVRLKRGLENITRPFMLFGTPALINRRAGEYFVHTLSGNEWIKQFQISLPYIDNQNADNDISTYLSVVVVSGQVHLFSSDGHAIFHHKLSESPSFIDDSYSKAVLEWNEISKYESSWTTSVFNGKPVLFLGIGGEFLSHIEGLQFDGNSWQPIFRNSNSLSGGDDFGIYFTGGHQNFVIVNTPHFLGSVQATTFKNGKRTGRTKIGSFPSVSIYFIFAISYIVLALLDLLIMRISPFWIFKYSITTYRESRQYPKNVANITDIMNQNIPRSDSYRIIKRQEHNAYTFSNKYFSASKWDYIGPTIIYLKEDNRGTNISIESKLQYTSLFLLLFFIGVLILVYNVMRSVVFPRNEALQTIAYLLIVLCVIVFPITYYIEHIADRKRSKKILDRMLVYWGIEKRNEHNIKI